MKLFAYALRQSLSRFLIYRSTSVFVIIFNVLFTAVELAVTLIYFQYTDSIAGFTFHEFVLLIATHSTISNLYQAVFINAHEELPELIIEGELDYTLMRPLDSQIIATAFNFEISSIISSIFPIGLSCYAILQMPNVNAFGMALYCLFIFIGVFVYYLLSQLFVAFSFWLEKPGALLGMVEYLYDAAGKPLRLYPRIAQIVFAWIIPIISITNIPVALLTINITALQVFVYLFAVAALMVITRIQWKYGIRRYSSAS